MYAGSHLALQWNDALSRDQSRSPRSTLDSIRASILPLALPEAFTTRAVGTLHIWGAVRLGKSEWALAQFENPLYVTERNHLLNFREGWHDGIVIDKLTLRDRPPGGFTRSNASGSRTLCCLPRSSACTGRRKSHAACLRLSCRMCATFGLKIRRADRG